MIVLSYPLMRNVNEQHIMIIGGQIVKVLCIQRKQHEDELYALVLQDGITTHRKIKMFPTGREVDPGLEYIGSVQEAGYQGINYYAHHYFMEKEQVDESQTLRTNPE